MHRDIKSASILLDGNWKAKISNMELSIHLSDVKPIEHVTEDNAYGSLCYVSKMDQEQGYLTRESDIYSFGVVLKEMLWGRLTKPKDRGSHHIVQSGKEILDDLVFEGIKERIDPQSLDIFTDIAGLCLAYKKYRPPAIEVIIKLQKSLNVQTTWVPKIRLEEILSATNHFSDENLIKEGELGKLYRGRLSDQYGKLMDIVARRLNCKYGQGDVMLQTEISMLSSLKHKNIISIVGFVDEKDEKMVIYDLPLHGILDQHISDPTLNWSQRLQICLGVARVLNHIHYDVIHCDLNSGKIFLDKDWEPKIVGFEFSTKYPQSLRHRILYSRYFDATSSITPKFDVYRFGELMFEILCGRTPMTIEEDVLKENVYDNIVHPDLIKQMGEQSLNCFLKTATACLKQEPVERPSMDQIVKELEEALELTYSENLEHSTAAADENATTMRLKEHSTAAADENATTMRLKMDTLRIPLIEIVRATNDFCQEFCIGSGGFGIVYKAQLDVLGIQDMSSIDEGKNKDNLPKINKVVAIKRIYRRRDEQAREGFLAEFLLLTSCKHPNVVSLLGFSDENREIILVYEYVSKGSLCDYFERRLTNLTWVQRLQISLDIAKGINYLHTEMEGKPRILHRDIKSDNILLDENLKAKVCDFGFSKFHPEGQQMSSIYSKHIAGTNVYIDPEYLHTGKYKKESDIYSFGIVLFEILSGRMAYDNIYMGENDFGLGPLARRRFNEGTLKELIDHKMIDEDDKHIFTINKGPNQQSFDAFSKIAYQCLAETQAKRPTMEDVIDKLEYALKLQGETIVLSRFQLRDIVFATENFSETYCIGIYAYGTVYKAELDHFDNKRSLVAVKRLYGNRSRQEEERFFSEIEMHSENIHPNVVSLLGFCDEQEEMILLYEHASKSLDDCLKGVYKLDNVTWTQRLQMCLGIALGLDHIHTKMDPPQHGDIRSANILLGKNWQGKIAYFGISNLQSSSGLKVYWDPEYEKAGEFGEESDIYSFGVVMFEILCGRLAYDQVYIEESERGLAPIARRRFKDGTIKKMIDPKLMEEADEKRRPNQDSLDTFLGIAYRCLRETQADRPTLGIVIKELERASNFQESQ